MTGRELPQDWLQAYVDEALNPAQCQAAEARLAADPALTEQLRGLRAENAAVRASVPEPDPLRLATLSARAEAAGHRPNNLLRAAAMIGVLAIGVGAGWVGASGQYTRQIAALQSETERLVLTAAAAHRLYSVEVLHPVEVTAAERDHLNGWLSNRLGGKIAAPDMAGTGYSLVGGRLLPGPDGAAAQFMYEDASGLRVTLFVAHGREGAATGLRFETEGDLTTVSWADPHWRYALVGALPRDGLEALARHMHNDLI